jgi:2-methylcitrate dehydratase
MVAIALLNGTLTANDYEEEAAENPLLDKLRSRMSVKEHKLFTSAYLDPEKRSIANAITIHFTDGTQTPRVEVEYPIGHPRRRQEGIPFLKQKFADNLATHFSSERVQSILHLFDNQAQLEQLAVPTLVDVFLE